MDPISNRGSVQTRARRRVPTEEKGTGQIRVQDTRVERAFERAKRLPDSTSERNLTPVNAGQNAWMRERQTASRSERLEGAVEPLASPDENPGRADRGSVQT